LQVNVHFHVLVPDGGFDDDGAFVADEAPSDDDVRRIMVRAGRRVMSKLHRFFDDDDERRREIDRLLEALDAASATPQPVLFSPRCAAGAVVGVHRGLLAARGDPRDGQRPSRAVAPLRLWRPRRRGVVALERAGRWPLRLPVPMVDTLARVDVKRALPDGRRKIVMTGAFLLEKLVLLISPVYAKLTRFIAAR
jgi:hypothetical protein